MNKLRNLIAALVLLLSATIVHAAPDSLSTRVVNLPDTAITILYRFETLKKYSSAQQAIDYWQQNKGALPGISDSERDVLAEQIFKQAKIKFSPTTSFSIQVWMKAQTISIWLFYLSAIIAIWAIFRLLHTHWNSIYFFLMKQFAPVVRFVFSQIALTYELILTGFVGIFAGARLEDFTIRTIIIHISLLIIWSQSTALCTRQYLLKDYYSVVRSRIKSGTKLDIFKAVFLPAIITAASICYVIYRHSSEVFYMYEVTVILLCAFLSLPFWGYIEFSMARLLLPFYKQTNQSKYAVQHYTAILLLLWLVAYIWLPVSFCHYFNAFSALLLLVLNGVSFRFANEKSNINYVYSQLLAISFFLMLFYKGKLIADTNLIWLSITGFIIFISSKYWEIPTFWKDWYWNKRNKKWGFLGMALLFWLIAKILPYIFSSIHL